ncbi:MAG: transcription elongation factor GreA [Bacteroidota bacterium]
MSQKSYYTKTSLEKFKKELDILETKERKAISDKISQAMAQGDLSENAEYHAAKEEQTILEMKIAKLKDEIAHAKIIDETQINTQSVSLLTKVKIKNQQTGKMVSYKLVPAKEANIKEGSLSIESPIGSGLLNKKVGDLAHINVPAGTLIFEILEIGL